MILSHHGLPYTHFLSTAGELHQAECHLPTGKDRCCDALWGKRVPRSQSKNSRDRFYPWVHCSFSTHVLNACFVPALCQACCSKEIGHFLPSQILQLWHTYLLMSTTSLPLQGPCLLTRRSHGHLGSSELTLLSPLQQASSGQSYDSAWLPGPELIFCNFDIVSSNEHSDFTLTSGFWLVLINSGDLVILDLHSFILSFSHGPGPIPSAGNTEVNRANLTRVSSRGHGQWELALCRARSLQLAILHNSLDHFWVWALLHQNSWLEQAESWGKWDKMITSL